MYTINFVFSKKGDVRFISHLDLMRLFMRAFRRCSFPLKITQGFNPHPKLSIKKALKLGLESDCEEAKVVLHDFVAPEEFMTRLQKELPQGVRINKACLEKS